MTNANDFPSAITTAWLRGRRVRRVGGVIVGLVVGLDYKNPLLDPHLEFQRLKTHPPCC